MALMQGFGKGTEVSHRTYDLIQICFPFLQVQVGLIKSDFA